MVEREVHGCVRARRPEGERPHPGSLRREDQGLRQQEVCYRYWIQHILISIRIHQKYKSSEIIKCKTLFQIRSVFYFALEKAFILNRFLTIENAQ